MSDLSKRTRKNGVKIALIPIFSFIGVFAIIAVIDANMNLQRVVSVWSLTTILVFETEELVKISGSNGKKQNRILRKIRELFGDSLVYFAYMGASIILSIIFNRILVQNFPAIADENLPTIITGVSLLIYFSFNLKIRTKKIDLEDS